MRLAVLWTNAAVSEKQSYKYLWNQNDEKKQLSIPPDVSSLNYKGSY